MSNEKLIPDSQVAAEVQVIKIPEFLHKNFLPYAHYVIMSRALVSEDGLKPVNRRVLFNMYKQDSSPTSPFSKAAKIASTTSGDYHPHGSASVEEALARLGQNFTMRIPLVEPYGSVGFVTGDRPAAARYWEARLTKAAMELVKDIDNGAVPMGKNYDGSKDEPTLLPIRWPNSIINGSQGIAVGYACEIYPHNPTEVMNACIEYVKNPELTVDELLKIMPGPDMPTGGELIESEGVKEYYTTGKGGFSLRGKYELTPLPRGQNLITFYELPYQVSVEKVREAIKQAQSKDKLKGIADHKDLTDRKSGLQLAIRTKSGVNPLLIVKELFAYTPAQQKFSVNSTVLDDGVPKVMPMLDLINQFVTFRESCIARRTGVKLDKIAAAIYRIDGMLPVLLDIDKAISIIRSDKNDDEILAALMKTFKIDLTQANNVLEIKLRQLKKQDRNQLLAKKAELDAEAAALRLILNSPEAFKAAVIADLEATSSIITDKRRTTLNGKTAEFVKEESKQVKKDATASAKSTNCYVTVFADYTITRTTSPLVDSNTPILYQIYTKTQEELIAITRTGIGVKIPVSYVPADLVKSADMLGVDAKDFIGLAKASCGIKDIGMLLACTNGEVNIVKSTKATSGAPFQFSSIPDGESIILAQWLTKANDTDKIFLVAQSGIMCAFPLASIRTSAQGAKLVRGMTLDDGDKAAAACVSGKTGVVITISESTIKSTDISQMPERKRGAKGVNWHKLSGSDRVIDMFAAEENVLIAQNQAKKKVPMPAISKRSSVGMKYATSRIVLGKAPTAFTQQSDSE